VVGIAGVRTTSEVATIRRGPMTRLAAQLRAQHLHPRRVLALAESVDRYFPAKTSVTTYGAFGFGYGTGPADLVVIDPWYAEGLPAADTNELRRRALAWGLQVHRVGRIEAWYRGA
jgi:hypothetical protein